MIIIRSEKKEDFNEIKEINIYAFNRENEANLVQKLRESTAFIPELSLVAVEEGEVVGHILFSLITIENDKESHIVLALAPMAVKPSFQHKGIGSKLVTEGLKKCKELGYDMVVVLGHSKFYPRFGFEMAKNYGIEAPFKVPDEVFMVSKLNKEKDIKGVVKYPKVFDEV